MGAISDFIDKVTPNEVTDFMNSAADKLMPKEIAPYMSIIAPMLAPYIGPGFAHTLAQLGSAKMNDGQLDPFAALAVHGAGATDTARGIRASYDPSKANFGEAAKAAGQGGTLGQRLSGAAGDFFSGDGIMGGTAGNHGNLFSRALQPTQSMFTSTSAANNPLFDNLNLGDHFKYMEREADVLKNLNKSQELNFIKDYKQFDMEKFLKSSNAEQDKLLRTGMEAVPEKASGLVSEKGKKAIEAHNANLKPTDVNYIKTSDQAQKILGDNIFEITPEINAMPSTNNIFDSATDGVMDFFMPELDESQQLLEGVGTLDPKKVSDSFKAMSIEGQIATVSSMTALTQASAIEKAMKDAEYKSLQERNAVYKAFFDNYEKHGRRKYNDPRYLRYKDPELVAIYNEIYGYQYGGRVKKNMGGIMQAPGVPENMELDYRESGGFIPMGGPERADDVPAMLSKNEFVLTADAMRGLDKMNGGSGDPRNAARQMYQMMEQMEAMA